MNKAYPSDLTNKEWQILKEYIPPTKAGGRTRKHDMRDIINAIMYRMRAGCQ
ncbi:MAG: transposase [bacterium]